MYTPKLMQPPIYIMDDEELEQIIFNHFGVEYEIVQEMFLHNDTHLVYDLNGELCDITGNEIGEIDEWLSGEDGTMSLKTLMEDLVIHNELPPGIYVIDCSW